MTTSPPSPPSPPLGPPRGTYFSRRKARQPLPPSPALTRIRTSSINMKHTRKGGHPTIEKPPVPKEPAAFRKLPRKIARLHYCRDVDADELAHPSAVLELHHARHLGKKRIVLTPADVRARLDLG